MVTVNITFKNMQSIWQVEISHQITRMGAVNSGHWKPFCMSAWNRALQKCLVTCYYHDECLLLTALVVSASNISADQSWNVEYQVNII